MGAKAVCGGCHEGLRQDIGGAMRDMDSIWGGNERFMAVEAGKTQVCFLVLSLCVLNLNCYARQYIGGAMRD
jgi:hypothetical protein